MPSTLPVWYIEAGSLDAGVFKRKSMGSAVIVGVRKTGESGLKRMLLTAQHVLRSNENQRSGPYYPEIRAWVPQSGYTFRASIRATPFADLMPNAGAPLMDAEDLAFLELPPNHGSLVCNLLDNAACRDGLEGIMIGGYPLGEAYLQVHNDMVDPSEHPNWRYSSTNHGLGVGILAPGDAPPREGVSGGGVFHEGLYAGVYRGEFNDIGEHLFLPIPWIRQWCSARGYELFSEPVKPATIPGGVLSDAMDALREAYPSQPDLEALASLLKLPSPVSPDYDKALFKLVEALATGRGYRQGIQLAATLRPGSQQLDALAYGLLPPAPPTLPALSIYDHAVFGESDAMVNRKFLRTSVEGIESFGSQRILIVKGSPLSGRGYSRHLIKHIARHLGMSLHWFRLKDVLLPRIDGSPAGVATVDNSPWEIARMLVDDVLGTANASPPALQTETEARWTMTVLPLWTISQLRAAPGNRWIVFEGFDQQLISEQVYNFLCWTASKIENALPGIRVAFLGYDRPVPAILTDAARVDEIGQLQRDDLVDFFKNFALQCDKKLEPAVLDTFVTLCWNDYVNDLAADSARPSPAPGDLPPRDNALCKLNNRLKAAIVTFR